MYLSGCLISSVVANRVPLYCGLWVKLIWQLHIILCGESHKNRKIWQPKEKKAIVILVNHVAVFHNAIICLPLNYNYQVSPTCILHVLISHVVLMSIEHTRHCSNNKAPYRADVCYQLCTYSRAASFDIGSSIFSEIGCTKFSDFSGPVFPERFPGLYPPFRESLDSHLRSRSATAQWWLFKPSKQDCRFLK